MRLNSSATMFFVILLVVVGSTGCVSVKEKHDYSVYRQNIPRSVLVMPPTNESIEVDAPYIHLSTMTRPLAEAGYYVFPVAVVNSFMQENGLPTPAEMHAVSLDKIGKFFAADAVLYINIEEWGQKYLILSSTTVVKAHAKLVDVKSGALLWEGSVSVAEGSGDGGGGLVGMLVAALVEQVADTVSGQAHKLSILANYRMVMNQHNGLLLGPYNSGYAEDARGR